MCRNITELRGLEPPATPEEIDAASWQFVRKVTGVTKPTGAVEQDMVKLRGVNVWPEAVGAIALEVAGAEADWFVRAVREGNRDALIVSVTSEQEPTEYDALANAIGAKLKDRLGVGISAEVVAPGALDAWTEVGTSPKLKRFRDDR